ncbi:Brp/Blh family beta-carotene 15,15'-monooxygenase [Sphingomonas sp. BK036]|uniref:Brp/Blh family beta-carotene 15,15'-dioxygenase n=1 Tax=Sphingomonas sp. BK036 TaxID=2512122 RepID=UPI001028E64C|nr:Brp/Blh family beta-carotene 15,15'-dioxygenase [Sphingomonas sp. BK036]RZT46371.1 Brp/Blh family beta-carotene 15,15'-monooxygenase [Sphingomonas sp. BK036]
MTRYAPALSWGFLLGAASIASFCSLAVQLTFAAIAVGIVGMVHGGSDLEIIEHRRRPAFLALYVSALLVCLWWWIVDPAIALPAFLLTSAVHFGLEDAPASRPFERMARGISLVATPATLHAASLTRILDLAGVQASSLPTMVSSLAIAGGIAAGCLAIIGVARYDRRLLVGTTALLVLPPLVGFSVGFLVLHAVPQTKERRDRLQCVTTTAYLRTTAPVLVAAVTLVGIVGGLLLRWDSSGVRSLFAGIAALAMPHLLVTPYFEGVARQSGIMPQPQARQSFL